MEIEVEALQLLEEAQQEEALYPCTWTCNSVTCTWTTCSNFE